MKLDHRVTICACGDQKRDHLNTKSVPAGPCRFCPCTAFTPEPVCICGHGKKAHAKGYCHESDGCKVFRPRKED
jgi:hypothetical protein